MRSTQIREITIRNLPAAFRQLTWQPAAWLVCLIARGDVGKSTVLDAIELALSPRSRQITDSRYYRRSTCGPVDRSTKWPVCSASRSQSAREPQKMWFLMGASSGSSRVPAVT